MSNLNNLYFSSNQIQIIPSKLFNSLSKLETLDLSFNKINFISSYSFNLLESLRNLHLNDNDPKLRFESNETFIECYSIQNIYLSKSILVSNEDDNNIKVILNLFEEKKKQTDPVTLKRRYFKSLFLIDSNYTQYDCNLTLFFIERNIHFNFKTETHIYDYFTECFFFSLKNASFNELIINRNELIFTNPLAYFFWLYLSFVLYVGFYWCQNIPIKREKEETSSNETNDEFLEKEENLLEISLSQARQNNEGTSKDFDEKIEPIGKNACDDSSIQLPPLNKTNVQVNEEKIKIKFQFNERIIMLNENDLSRSKIGEKTSNVDLNIIKLPPLNNLNVFFNEETRKIKMKKNRKNKRKNIKSNQEKK